MRAYPTLLLAGLFAACVAAPAARAARSADGVTCRVELDRGVLPAGQSLTTIVKVTLDAPAPPEKIDRPPVNLALVLDRSGSMTGTKIQKAREAAIEAVRRLGPQDRFSLVIYNHQVETLIPAQSVSNKEAIISRIREIQADGNTALFGGVSQAAAEIRRHLDGSYVHRIVLLSDGLANVGPSSPDDLGRLGTSLLKEQITVSTVGVGTDYNEDLMTRLAQRSDGNTYFVESEIDLPRIFAAELGDVLNVVARRVLLEITCPEGMRPVRILGRDGRIRGNTVELQLNQLYGGQEKYTLVEVEVPASAPDQELEIASARCRYEDAFTQQTLECADRVSARFSPRNADVVASGNKDVQQEIVRNRIALAKDEAIELWDKGEQKQAVRALRDNFQQLRAYNTANDLQPALQMEADQLADEAQVLEQQGAMSKGQRKALRAESYQQRYQQNLKQ